MVDITLTLCNPNPAVTKPRALYNTGMYKKKISIVFFTITPVFAMHENVLGHLEVLYDSTFLYILYIHPLNKMSLKSILYWEEQGTADISTQRFLFFFLIYKEELWAAMWFRKNYYWTNGDILPKI